MIVDMNLHVERMKERRLALGLTQESLAALVGVTQKAIAKWESGNTARPSKLKELAESLQCSDDWLLGGADKPSAPKGIGVISQVHAGKLAEAIDNYSPGDAEEFVDYDGPCRSDKMIALRVKGTSMNYISPEGSIIFVDLLDREMTSNRLYVVKVGDDNEVTYKRYKASPPRLEPDSADRHHEPIYLDGKPYQAVGRVIRTMMDFD